MKKAVSGTFRRKTNFAAVSNYALKDFNLSLKAKGLYALIQSYITLPDKQLKKSDLISKCKEGEKAFNTIWKELKDAGYLKIYRSPTGDDDQFVYEYELLDEADLSRPSFLTLNKHGEVIRPKGSVGEEVSHTPQKGGYAKSDPPAETAPDRPQENKTGESESWHIPQNGGYANSFSPADPEVSHPPLFSPYADGTPCEGHPVPDGGDIDNIKENKIKNNKTIRSISHSSDEKATVRRTDEIVEELKDQIDYGYFEDNYPEDLSGIDCLLLCLAEMLSAPSTRINGVQQSLEILAPYIQRVSSTSIVEFLDHMRGKSMLGIKNIYGYWRSSFVNFLVEQNLILLSA